MGEGTVKGAERERVGRGWRVAGCFELSRAGGGVHSVVGEGQKGTGEVGWLVGTGAEGRPEARGLQGERVSRVVEHRGPLVV